MKKKMPLVLLLLAGVVLATSAAPFKQVKVTDAVQVDAARGIIGRITPSIVEQFSLEIIPQEEGLDVYEIESVGGKVVLRGNNGVSLASAYYLYLKEFCGVELSWNGDQLNVPKKRPVVPEKIRTTCLHEYRVYFNYCTFNYTASWWDWERWQREIDFMAMNGINMPLSVVGLEAVWYHTLLKMGFTDLQAREYLVGPTYFAWQWMTNMHSFGGPLPKEWIDRRIVVGRKILERQRALGMTPIQQGFTGSVPLELAKKFPEAKILHERGWCGFTGTDQLDPLDPLFMKFGTTFLETEIEIFGTSHIYAADPFHEGKPPQTGKEYLHKVGKTIEQLMVSVDPKATIAMQSWSIRKDICTAFSKDRIIVLDLAGRRNDFWGYKYVKGQLHNFGGRINMHGDLAYVAENPFAKAANEHELCCGMGLFPEGIEQNPVFYNMVFDMIWRDAPVDANAWLNDYAFRRYGKKSKAAEKAWALLLKKGPYRRGTNGIEKSSIIVARPALNPKRSAQGAGFHIPYDPQTLVEVWSLLLSDYDALKDSAGYQFDLIDMGRQVLSNLGQELNKDVAIAFNATDQAGFKKATTRFLDMLYDVDGLLASVPTHSFEKWVSDARGHSEDLATQDYYEWNASMLLTIWGMQEDAILYDYAWREWSGLIRLFYIPRWEKLYAHLTDLLEQGKGYEDPTELSRGREAFRASEFYEQLADWEMAWTEQRHTFPKTPVVTSKELFKKYTPLIQEIYSPERKERMEKYRQEQEKVKSGKVIETWNPKGMSTEWIDLKVDTSKLMGAFGTYELEFKWTKGRHRLDIRSVVLLCNGIEIAQDVHAGTTGLSNKKNIYSLEMKDFVPNAKYEIKASVRSAGGTDSYGEIRVRKK